MKTSHIKILLVNSPNLGDILTYIAPSLGVERLQFYCRQCGFDVEIWDRQLGDAQYESYLHRIKQGEFTVIGYSSTQMSLEMDSIFFADCRFCMPNDTYLVVGGFSPTFKPDIWLKAGAHVVILGYGERPFSQFCKLVAERNIEQNISKIAGIAYYASLGRQNSNTHTQEKIDKQYILQLAENVDKDTFRLFAYDNQKAMHVEYDKYWQHNKGKEYLGFGTHTFKEKSISLYTTSTCPNHCGYCGSNKFLTSASGKKHHLQMLTVDELFDLVLSEIDKYQPDRVFFADDDFLASPQRGLQFANLITDARKNGQIDNDIVFCCQARLVDFLRPDKQPNKILMQALKDANFNHISLGVESFNEKVLHNKVMNKFGYSALNAHSVINACVDIGLNAQVNIMLFSPNETIEDVMIDVEHAFTVVKKGLAIAVTGPIWAFFGTTCYDDDSIKCSTKGIHLPFSNEDILLKDTLLSNYPEVQKVIDALEEKVIEVLAFYGFASSTKCSRQIYGIMRLEAISNICGYKDMSKQMHDFIITHLEKQ